MTDTEHLETRYVFVDTQAYIANGFDWTGPHLGKLAELCSNGTLTLLLPSITRREIHRNIEEGLDEAIERTKKFGTALRNGGLNVELLSDRPKLVTNAFRQFEAFLRNAEPIDIPLDVSLEGVLDDYFNRRPPFSDKKDKEFPDAFVGASLVAWLRSHNGRAYVVSADPDWKTFCDLHHSLILAKTISDVISPAIVSAETHAVLVNKIRVSTVLNERLESELKNLSPRPERGLGRRIPPGLWMRGQGDVTSAKVLGIIDVNVIDSSPPSYACEIEFEAELKIRAKLVDETETSMELTTRNISVERTFVTIVELLFDASGADVTIENIHFQADLVVRREDL